MSKTNPKLKNEVGARYGLLTVIEQAGNYKHGVALWRCRCDCGTEKVVAGAALRFGFVVSCGCKKTDPTAEGSRAKNEIGTRHGHWLVLAQADPQARRGRPGIWWLCRCDCGTERVIGGGQLRDRRTTSCGCCRRERRMDSRKSTFHAAFGGYQRHARDRKFAFEISEERVHQLFDGDCFYCGASPIPKQVKTRRSSFARNGIDRVNSEIGYLEGNVVSCCEDCNIAKMKRSATDFIDHCRRVTEHQARAAVA